MLLCENTDSLKNILDLPTSSLWIGSIYVIYFSGGYRSTSLVLAALEIFHVLCYQQVHYRKQKKPPCDLHRWCTMLGELTALPEFPELTSILKTGGNSHYNIWSY